MAKNDTEVDPEKGTISSGRNSSSTTEKLKTTRSLPKGTTSAGRNNSSTTGNLKNTKSLPNMSSVPNCDYMDIKLHQAAKEDNVEDFKKVLHELSKNLELNIPSIIETVTPTHNTLLHVASLHGVKEIVEVIVQESPSTLKKKNLRGETALHTAIKAEKKDTVSSLIRLQKESASSNDKDDNLFKMKNVNGNTALHEALIHRLESVAIDLINVDPEVSFYENNEGKSPLYLAAEAGYFDCVKAMMESEAYKRYNWPCQNSTAKDDQTSSSTVEVGDDQKDTKKNDKVTKQDGVPQVKSPIHAAVVNAAKKRKNPDVLKYMLDIETKFIDLRDEKGRSALHIASSLGYLDGVKCFLEKDPRVAFQRDDDGLFPVHWATEGNNVDVINELRPYGLDLEEMLSHSYQNILHYAAKNANSVIVSYVLKTEKLEKLINQKDKDGNTALHLAAKYCHPLCVILLIKDNRVDKKLLNDKDFTALDACKYLDEGHMLQHLTVLILKKYGVKPSQNGKPTDTQKKKDTNKDDEKFRGISNALLVVATLVATVTFAAGFTLPGGYNDSGDEQGIATMLRRSTFHAFVICDTVAMYSSIFAAIIFTWAQLGGEDVVSFAYKLALPSLALALTMMSLAYFFGIYVAVSKLGWLAKLILGLGLLFQWAIVQSFFLLCFSFIKDWDLRMANKIFNLLASIIYVLTKSG